MQRAQAALLPDGRRLHLQHGPIDLIVEASGPGRGAAYRRAAHRFDTVLEELVAELPQLRAPIASVGAKGRDDRRLLGAVAQRMYSAVLPFASGFVTPMAAVAGAVADEILSEIIADATIEKAYVNNGGDIAIHLGPGEAFVAAIAGAASAHTQITGEMRVGGIATSGWRGRSHSLGIADSVTVLAKDSATADAAATLIANAVDLPGHPGIGRVPASDLSPDCDLGKQLVTRAVPILSADEATDALRRGLARAQNYLDRDRICATYLTLQGESRVLAIPRLLTVFKETAHA